MRLEIKEEIRRKVEKLIDSYKGQRRMLLDSDFNEYIDKIDGQFYLYRINSNKAGLEIIRCWVKLHERQAIKKLVHDSETRVANLYNAELRWGNFELKDIFEAMYDCGYGIWDIIRTIKILREWDMDGTIEKLKEENVYDVDKRIEELVDQLTTSVKDWNNYNLDVLDCDRPQRQDSPFVEIVERLDEYCGHVWSYLYEKREEYFHKQKE